MTNQILARAHYRIQSGYAIYSKQPHKFTLKIITQINNHTQNMNSYIDFIALNSLTYTIL